MAKTSMVERERKRQRTVRRYAARRAELKRIIKDRSSSPEALADALEALQRLPRDSSPVRLRNRCAITGRPQGLFQEVRAEPQQAARRDHVRQHPRREQSLMVSTRTTPPPWERGHPVLVEGSTRAGLVPSFPGVMA